MVLQLQIFQENRPAICEERTDGGNSVPGKLANVEILRLSVNLQLVLHSPRLVEEGAVPGVLRGVRLDGDQAEDVLVDGGPHPAGQLRGGEVEARVDVLSVDPGEEGTGGRHVGRLLPVDVFLSECGVDVPLPVPGASVSGVGVGPPGPGGRGGRRVRLVRRGPVVGLSQGEMFVGLAGGGGDHQGLQGGHLGLQAVNLQTTGASVLTAQWAISVVSVKILDL